MVNILEKNEIQIDEVTLNYIKDYTLIVTRKNNIIIELYFKDHASTGKGFTITGSIAINNFVELLKEFINVREI